MIEISNECNMILMARYPDNYFDLAIVDPPYGLNFGKYNRVSTNNNGKKYISNNYHKGNWDSSTPTNEYFDQLFRVSKNQIVWGGNYFIKLAKIESPNIKTIDQFNDYIKNSSENWLFWYKQNPVPNFADGELAWLSFNKNDQFDFRYYGNIEGNTSTCKKIHPTQKPIKLYEYLLMNYAKGNDKILDTHLGSGSIALACHNLGYDLIACELDKEYYEASLKRLKEHQSQIRLNL